jgi:hypothetical protein
MGTARLLVPRFADDRAAVDENATDDGVRVCAAAPALRELERALEAHAATLAA